MTHEVVVEFRQVLPLADPAWLDAFLGAVEDLVRTLPVRTKTDEDLSADIVFLVYGASDHERIVVGSNLADALTQLSGSTSTEVVLVACANCSPPLKDTKVRDLLINQGAAVVAFSLPGRARTPEALVEIVRRTVEATARRKRLSVGQGIATNPERVSSINASAAQSVRTMDYEDL